MEIPKTIETPIRHLPTPILDDPIFTEDDESEDETLKNQLDIVNREVISFIPKSTVVEFARLTMFFVSKYIIRYNTPCSLRVSVGILYKLESCEVELYNV